MGIESYSTPPVCRLAFRQKLHAGGFERAADRLHSVSASSKLSFLSLQSFHRWLGNSGCSSKVALRPAEQGACGFHLSD